MSMCLVIFAIILYVFIFRATIQTYDTDLWKVTINHKTNYRSLTPLSGNFTHVFMWFHDFNEDTKLAQSFFIKDKFYAKNTKVVFM